MKKAYIIILLIIGFSSCETETYVDYFIDNQSSTSITVKGTDIIHDTAIDLNISPGNLENIAGWRKLGKSTEPFDPASMFGENLIITNSAGDTLKKDYRIQSNWEMEVDERRAVAAHSYVLRVLDIDF